MLDLLKSRVAIWITWNFLQGRFVYFPPLKSLFNHLFIGLLFLSKTEKNHLLYPFRFMDIYFLLCIINTTLFSCSNYFSLGHWELFQLEPLYLFLKFILFIKNFIEVQLIYNVVLVSGVQQSDSVICTCMCVYIYTHTHTHTHTHISFCFRFFSHIDYYKILSIVPCAILVGYLFFIW